MITLEEVKNNQKIKNL